jgi:hypothetical protein
VNLEVTSNKDGTYEVFFNNEHVCKRLPAESLNDKLCGTYGFCGDELRLIRAQLAESGRATMKLMLR